MQAIIKGKTYLIAPAAFNDTTGPQDPSITNQFIVLRDQFDRIGDGYLTDLGKNFGYRLIIRGNRGQQLVTELTRDEVVIIRDNA